MEQFRAVRKEIADNTAEIRSLQRYALVTVAVVWSWLATNPAPKWAAFLPLVFVVLGTLHTWRVLRETGDMGLFIGGAIEPYFAAPATAERFGWEEWLRALSEKERKDWYLARAHQVGRIKHDPMAAAPVWLMWVVLTVAIVGVGWLQVQHPLSGLSKKEPCCVPVAACTPGNR